MILSFGSKENEKEELQLIRPLRLGKYFGTTSKFWLGLQANFDIEEEQNQIIEQLKK